ncbi:MAG: VOC family protein [Luteimonas sp.]
MLAYATIGTNDLPRAAAFYDALLAEVGGKRFMEEPDYFIAWGSRQDGAGLGVTVPFDKKPACTGNGCMVALQADSREQVDRLYAKALELGGTDEGAPGQRSEGFYAAYFRDLDGNKLNACYMG